MRPPRRVITAPPEEKIPVETVEKKGGKTWLWVLLGLAVVGGGIAALAGGGGDDGGGGSSSSSDGGDTTTDGFGDVTVSW